MNKPFFPTANHVHCLRTDERILGGRLFALLLCLSALLSLAAGTAAADCPNAVTVTTAADGGAGSLRQAIADVCTGGIITFKGAYTIRLAAPLTIDRDVTIDGADHTVISGDTDGNGVGDQSLVMVGNLDNTVNPTATLKNLTLTSGIAVSFAPIMNFSTLTLDHVHVLNNLVPTISTFNRGTLNVVDSDFSNTLTGYSDGIFNIGVLNVTRATFSGNAGAIDNNSYGNSFSPRATIIDSAFVNNTGTLSPGFYGGGIIYNSNQGTLTVSGSTFNGNTASPQGVIRNDTGGTLVVTNSTFSGNLLPALDEYGFGVVTIRNTGNMTLTNTTFADNRGVKDAINLSSFPPPASGDIVRFFNNVFVKAADEAACAHDVYISTPQESSNNLFTGYCGKDFPTPTGFTLKTAAEINLGELGNYGGLTQTIPLLAGSAGIDAGNAGACPATDQRGFSRAGTCDIGAYEYNYTGIYYVKQGGSGAEDCRSWENACDLQTALRSAHSGDEVWVAAGVYKPTADTSKRDATLQLVSGVGVYGGFSGGESTRTARNPKTHQVVLSGDIDNNDTQTPVITDVDAETSNNGNSYHVVNGASGATLDGVTITAGYLHGAHYSGVGAGMTINSTMKIANVIFIGNSADGGGGLYNNGGSPELKDVTFRRNEAFNNGGGMLVTAGSPVLMGVTFIGNISKIKGGGMVNWVNSKAVLTNVTFSGNTAGEAGGGMYNYGSSPALTNVAFNLNTALKGGGMFNDNGSNPTIGNNIFWGDTGGEIYNGDLDSAPLVSDSVVQGGYTGGTHIITTDPLLGALGDYGGLTQTIPLLPGSAAIDAGSATSCPVTDQRGVARLGACDIGAYEYNYTGIYYVKQGGSGTADCRSWANACDLQTALRSAHSGDEVWVAAGVYKPTADTSKRDATFQLVSGVGVYGGFSGGESTRTARDPKTHQVVLSGDIDNNDTQTPIITDVDAETSNNGNSYHVVNGASGATLDGVTITAGYLHGAHYSGVGAGMTNNSTMKIANVIFIGNSADGGGGLYNNGGSPELKDVTFRRNEAFNNGGGMLVTAGSPVLMGVTFSGNISKIKGGGMVNWVNGKAVLTNVTFSGNTAGESGGGMYNYGSSPALTNVAFNLNTALKGGGMFNDNGSNPTIGNNIFWGDTGGEIYNGDLDSAPLVSDSVVQGGYTGGTHIITTDPLLGALGDYGGLTQTIPLLPGSAAINAGNTGACPARDQRGKNRVGGCDIGAFESQGFTLTKTGDDQSAVINTPFAAPLAVIVSSAYGEPVNGGVVAFAAGSSPEGASAQLSGGSVLISGGAAGVTATANGAAGTYDVMTSTVGASAAKFSLTNSRIATTTVLVSSANPALLGNAITFTATVSPAPDGGTVEFRDGSSVIIGCAAQPVSLGQAVCGASSLSLGTHGITAFYSGSPNYLAGDNSATPLQQQVNQPAYTVTAVVGEHGALDPTTPSPASVTSNQQTTFRFMADSGYHLTTVTGCGGTLSGDTYTTAPITGACAVTAAFAPDPANIGVTPSSPFDFGGVNVGASSAAQTFTIANSGNLQLNMGPITTDNTEFRISNNYCSSVAELPPGGACTLQVTFIPASGGQRSGALSIVSNDPDTSDFKVLLNGVGQAANIEVSPASPIAFGGVKVGASSTARTVTITNSGNLPLNIGQISTATTEFGLANDTCSNHPVAAGGACALDLTFSPTAIGSRSALLDIPSDDPDTPHAYISLNGLGQAAQINVTPSSPVIFGSVNAGAASAPLTFTITNSGNDELSIAGIVTSNPEFSVGNDTCSFRTVAVGAGCALDVTFAPTGNGDRTGNLRIPSNDPGGEAVVALSGTGIQYGLVVSGGGSTASGVVTGGSGINCGIAPQGVTSGTCMEPVNPGASVTLTATPQIGAGVTWSGCDSIPATPATSCTVNVTTATTVTATFTLNNYNLNVTRSGNGVVTSTPAGITRGGVCTMSYPYNTTVTLTAVPAVGFALSGWSGCDSASGNLCTVVMTGTRNVAAAFAPTASGVTVIAPNGGESVRAGNSLTIRWQVTGNPGGALRIELLKRGAVNQTISSGVPMSVGSYQWTVPVTQTAGNDYSVKITSAASASYKDSSDRAFSITAAPDLIISALTVPASAPPGQAITVSDTVNNNGPGVAPGSAIYYYLSTDSVWDAGDTYLGSRSIPSLAARAANSGCSVITLPSVMAAGTWYLIAKADGPGAIAETNEANNSLAKSFQSTPDLIVSALTGATSVKGGQSVSYSVTTKNQGTAVTPATTTSLYWTTKNTWDGRAVSLGSCAVASLAAGAAAMCPINVTIPAGTPGKYYVIAVSDVTAQVAEISETNNTANLKVTVAP